MKLNILVTMIVLASLTLFSGCGQKKIKSKAEPKKVLLEVSEITRKGLTTIEETIQIGPESNYDNTQKKPRREIQSSISILTKPDFPISISFKNTNLSDALLALGNLGGKNILVDDGVNGFLTLNVNNEPWNKVFNSIIEMKNLSYKGSPSDSIIKIYGGSNNTKSVKSNEIFNIYYEKPSELKKQIENLFADSGNSTIINANDENKTLIVQSSVSQINEIEKIINKIDVKKAQILIEAFLLEVKPTFEKKLGTRIGLSREVTTSQGVTETIQGGTSDPDGEIVELGTAVGSATNFLVNGSSGLGIMRSIGSKKLKFEIDALETEGDSRTLSNPKLFTISGKNATITQGTQFGVNQTTTTDGVTTTETKYYNANLNLDVTPVITGDGNVTLEVKITNDSVSFERTPPTITKKEVNTNLVLSSGDIAVVGGILTQETSEKTIGVPGLKKIPLLGALFRSKVDKDDKTELLIFLAPSVI